MLKRFLLKLFLRFENCIVYKIGCMVVKNFIYIRFKFESIDIGNKKCFRNLKR